MNLPTRTRRLTFGLWLAAGCGDDGAATTTTQGPTGSATDSHDTTSVSGPGATATSSDETTDPAVPTTSMGDSSTTSESTAQPTTVDPADDTTTGVAGPDFEQLGDGEFWSRRIGTAEPQSVTAMVATDDGFIISGATESPTALGEGVVAEGNGFFARFGLDGSPLWVRDVGTLWVEDIAVGPNGEVVVLMSDFTSNKGDIHLSKYGPDGTFMWGKVFGDPNYQGPEAVAVNAAGEILLGGSFESLVDFGGGPLIGQAAGFDGFIAHLDGDGEHIWSRAIGKDGGRNAITDIAATGEGFVIVGYCSGPVDFGDGPVPDSGHAGFVALYGPDHAVQWKHIYNTVPESYGTDRVAIGGGAVYVTGTVSGVVDFGGGPIEATGNTYLVKLDATGAHVWSHLFGAPECMQGASCGSFPINLVYSPGKGVIVSGAFADAIDFGGGPLMAPPSISLGFAAMFDESGAYGWSRTMDDTFSTGAADASGEWVLGATFNGDIDLGYGTHSSAGDGDIVLARLPWSG